MEIKDYYKVLGISSTASNDEIRKAYLKKNLENHPDKLGINENSEVWEIANEYIKLLNEAYHVLSDPLLREKYDEENNLYKLKNDFSENKKNQSTFSENNNDKKTPVTFNYEKVSIQLKNIIKNRQNKEHLYKIKTKGVVPSYIGSIILFVWFPILYLLSNSSQWKEETVFYYLISIVVSMLIFRLVLFIIKWHKSDIKWNLLITPLYFIFTEFEKITYYYLWDLKNVKATNNYKNGIYQNTSVVLYLGNITYNISFQSEKEYKNFISLVDLTIKRAAYNQNNFYIDYFIANDDLLNI